MKKSISLLLIFFMVFSGLISACSGASNPQSTSLPGSSGGSLKVLAVESYLADITRAVSGDRAKVDSLIPIGVDPHAYEPAPRDAGKIAESNVVVINGAGLESWLDKTLQNAGGQHQIIDASQGLKGRTPGSGETDNAEQSTPGSATAIDPHFWLDPVLVIQYVENIRAGLTRADPAGAQVYAQNAQAYTSQLKELDTWIRSQVQQIPEKRRLLVTNHETLGYFADQYGFKIIGSVIPSLSSEASPSAQQIARLIDAIRATGAPAIFLETGTNAQLADQVAQETGVKVVTDLYTHSLTGPEGPAPTYLAMMRYNTEAIVGALK